MVCREMQVVSLSRWHYSPSCIFATLFSSIQDNLDSAINRFICLFVSMEQRECVLVCK